MFIMKKLNNNMYSILKGFLIALLASIVSIWIYAVILVKTNVQESTITTVLISISGISVLLGSSISCLRINRSGILIGACIGLLYFLSLYILSSIALCGFSMSVTSLIMMLVIIVLGAIGGIIGVNLKNKI